MYEYSHMVYNMLVHFSQCELQYTTHRCMPNINKQFSAWNMHMFPSHIRTTGCQLLNNVAPKLANKQNCPGIRSSTMGFCIVLVLRADWIREFWSSTEVCLMFCRVRFSTKSCKIDGFNLKQIKLTLPSSPREKWETTHMHTHTHR